MDSFEDICLKKQDKIIDLTWNEIAAKFNMVSGESARCKWKRVRKKKNVKKLSNDKTHDNSSDFVDSNNKNQYVSNRKSEIIQLRDERRLLRNIVRELSRIESFKQYIKDVADNISFNKPLMANTSYDINIPRYKDGVLLLSDWHSELEVDNFLNTFNKNVFKERIGILIAKTIIYGNFHNIKTLHIVNLGDLTNGIIHTTARIMDNEDIISQIMYISELLAEMLTEFSHVFPQIKFYSVSDNHGRVTANKKESISKENFSRIIPWYLDSRLKDIDNIEICEDSNLDHEISSLNVCGYNILAVHGHRDRLNSIVSDLSLMTKLNPDYILSSHIHHNVEDEIHGIELIVNPSLIGTDDYAMENRYSSKPAQKLLIFNPVDGRECTYSIQLKE